MITLIEARHYRSLRYIRQALGPFHVLVGPNASGKTTFLDVVAFLGRLVSDGVEAAVAERTANFVDLVWQREDTPFELAIECEIPTAHLKSLADGTHRHVRYEVEIGLHPGSNEQAILQEKVFFIPEHPRHLRQGVFPDFGPVPDTVVHKTKSGWERIVGKTFGGSDNFTPELRGSNGKGWSPSFKLGHRKSALGMLPDDDTRFPVATWLKTLLTQGVQQFVLNSGLMRKPSPPNQRRGFNTDGSNLPWVIAEFKTNHARRFQDWIAHLGTTLPDVTDIDSRMRVEDRHAYVRVNYRKDVWIPSWMVSDGTLRMMALTLPAYIPDFQGIYLIEEPENGIHPKAIETVYQSLSSVYNAQILVASHSPIILSQAAPSAVLCFAKEDTGATDIISGDQHPRLKEWHGETTLGSLLAAGVPG